MISTPTLHSPGRFALAIIATVSLSSAASAAAPPVACTNAATGSMERAVCDSPLLSSLDVEVQRLFNLAVAAPVGASATQVRQQQATWMTSRARCTHDPHLATCLRNAYLRRIATLRTQSLSARAGDSKGTSLGPFVFTCHGSGALTITYVNVTPPLAWIAQNGHTYPMEQGMSGSGARYVGNGRVFWEHQGQASWQTSPTARASTCKRLGSG